jgi:hypothetical protein
LGNKIFILKLSIYYLEDLDSFFTWRKTLNVQRNKQLVLLQTIPRMNEITALNQTEPTKNKNVINPV